MVNRGDRGEPECRLLNFYPKLYIWLRLRKLIRSKCFLETAHVYHSAGAGHGTLPSEPVIFRYNSVLLVVTKSWCSAANSTGHVSTEQCLECGQAISLVEDLGNALNGNYTTPRHNAIEASISDVLVVDNFHQHPIVGTTVARWSHPKTSA